MRIIGEKLSNKELLMVKGGCDIDCYCGSLWLIICGAGEGSVGAVQAYNDHNCPTGNPGDPGYPGGASVECPMI